MRGYYGIGIALPKREVNVGGLLRSAHVFGAAFVFTVGERYERQASDTTAAWRHVPLHHYADFDAMWEAIPYACVPIAVERRDDARCLSKYAHPERALYILGPEDGSVPTCVIERCRDSVIIPGRYCLNVATAGSIVMYDRAVKREANGPSESEGRNARR